jgi:SAM-dependent methyltransferase
VGRKMTSDEANEYVLGHSDRELERLRRQAQLVNPITRQYLVEAGMASGMRVLDIGSGAGDVAFLAADLVGQSGQVVGVDRSPDALVLARSRAIERSLANVSFHVSDLSAMAFDPLFDAAVGRYVLCFQSDPVALLRKITRLVRPGGIVLFHEADREQMRSYPPTSTYDNTCHWLDETYRGTGMDRRMGVKLYSTFLAAGLAAPTMRLHAVIGGAKAVDEVHLEADQAIVLAADMARLGRRNGRSTRRWLARRAYCSRDGRKTEHHCWAGRDWRVDVPPWIERGRRWDAPLSGYHGKERDDAPVGESVVAAVPASPTNAKPPASPTNAKPPQSGRSTVAL